ncbi:hypothetical protein ACFPIJ_48260 [Dactylosporangium cerinum]|uniref:Uncharacterized protein n=1 Tax=Dactylosporangium cerinum TaxID=1434730 RepID=A0ABV9WA32_9ACTN
MSTSFDLTRIEQLIGALADNERQRLATLLVPIRDRLLAQRPADAKALQRDLAAAARVREQDAAIREHVGRLADAAPALDAGQRDRLAVLLTPVDGGTAMRQAPRAGKRPADAIVATLERLLVPDPVAPAMREQILTLLVTVAGDGDGGVPSAEVMIECLRHGPLRIPDPPTPVRAAWRRTISAALRLQLVPEGHQLRHHGRDRGDLIIELQPATPAPARPAIVVPADTELSHPLVEALHARPAALAVSPQARPRALRLIQALAVAATRRGHIVDLPPGDSPGVQFTKGASTIVLAVVEEDDIVDVLPSGDDLKGPQVYDWQRISPQQQCVPSGRLMLELPDDLRFHGRRRRWADRQRWRLEDKLGHVLAELEYRAAAQAQAEQEAQLEAADRRQRWEAAMAAARATYIDAHYNKTVRKQVKDWQRAQAARAYAAALAATVGEPPAPPTAEHAAADDPRWTWWIARIRRYADDVDPLLPTPRLPAPPPEPEPDQLRPFLDGWSPYGPDSHR